MYTGRAHVNTLPAEVLGHCFEYLRLRDRIRATEVCARWRSVALDHAVLWCELEDVGMTRLTTLLPRTKRVGVRITAQVADDASIDALCQLIVPHMDHILLLDLDIHPRNDREDWTELVAVLSAQAPRLEAFSLVIHQSPTAFNLDAPLFGRVVTAFTLDVPLFGGVASKLHSLPMDGWKFTVPSAATQNVVALYAPGVVHTITAGTAQPSYPLYASGWAQICPAVRELHLTGVSEIAGLRSPTNPFPAHLRTLVLEFTTNILAPSVVADVFQLLQEANFARMPEVTLLHSHPLLVDYVLQALGNSIVSLELASRHVRLVTDTGSAINFMRADFSGLEDAVYRNISRFAPRLRTLHLGTRVLGIFGGVTLARICDAAQGLERLVLTGLPSPLLWWPEEVLNLPALREMRLLAPLEPGRNIRADDLAGFVRDRVRLSPGAAPPTLTLESVEMIVVPQGCAVSCEMLADILWEVFGDVSLDQSPRASNTQRADMFVRAQRTLGEKTIWIAQGH